MSRRTKLVSVPTGTEKTINIRVQEVLISIRLTEKV